MHEAAMNYKHSGLTIRLTILAMILSGTILSGTTWAQSAATPPAATSSPAPPSSATHYHPNHFPKKAGEYYDLIWGVDTLSVKAVESGELIRFTYRVLNPEKARVLNDKKIEAFLDSPKANARLVIPSLEKVGQLRQVNTPEAGRLYWMAFSNPRRTVKRGDHVSVVIGQFHADGLVVE
jgi:hypothetical protein